jgi:hypothetical protein
VAKKKRKPSKSLEKHRVSGIRNIGRALFERAEATGVEPETLATTEAQLVAIKAYEDHEYEKYYRQLLERVA